MHSNYNLDITTSDFNQTSGTYCPGPVTFTCVGTRIGAALFWRVNGFTEADYAFESSHETFPRSVNINIDGVTVEIISASANPPGSLTTDITSVFNVSDVSVLNGASLHCADLSIQSNTFIIEVVNTLGNLILPLKLTLL